MLVTFGFLPGFVLGAATVILVNKYYNKKPSQKKLNEVLFTNNSSGCCSVFDPGFLCENRYCKGKNEARLIKLINSARISICLSMYIFTCKSLANAIVEAHARGVVVRIITDTSMLYSSNSQAHFFSQMGNINNIL